MAFCDNPCARPVMRIAGFFSAACLLAAFACTTWLGFYCASLARGLAFAAIIVPAASALAVMDDGGREAEAMRVSACLAAAIAAALLFGIFFG